MSGLLAMILSPWGRRLALALSLVAIFAAGFWWVRHDAAQQREQELLQETYKDRILRLQETKERRDAAEALDDDGLLDALGRWIMPAQ